MLVLAVGLHAWSCSGESSFPIPANGGPIDAGAFVDVCSVWANAACDFADRCPFAAAWASHGQCVWRNTLECELVAVDPDVDFDEAALRACAASDVSCAVGFPSLTECLPPGQLPDQSPCALSASCRSKACERPLDPETGAYAMCGTCFSATPPCNVTCLGGYACVDDGDAGPTCVPPVALGESCAQANCQGGFCDPTSRVCVSGPGLGDSCCGAGCDPPCAPNSFCDSTRHCAPQQLVPYGGQCDPYGSVCVGGASCVGVGLDGGTYTSKCYVPIADGLPCDPPDGSVYAYVYCLWPARCTANRCLYPSATLCSK